MKPNLKETIANKSDVYLLNDSMRSMFDNRMTYNIRPTGAVIASMLTHTYAAKVVLLIQITGSLVTILIL